MTPFHHFVDMLLLAQLVAFVFFAAALGLHCVTRRPVERVCLTQMTILVVIATLVFMHTPMMPRWNLPLPQAKSTLAAASSPPVAFTTVSPVPAQQPATPQSIPGPENTMPLPVGDEKSSTVVPPLLRLRVVACLFDWRLLVGVVFCTGTLFFLLQWLFGIVRLRGIIRRAKEHNGVSDETGHGEVGDRSPNGHSRYSAPEAPVGFRRHSRSEIGCPPHIRLLFSSEIDSPFVCSLVRPMIVLPTGLSDEALRFSVAHEMEHLRRFDLLTWRLLNVMRLLFWVQPLFWTLRHRVRIDQDYLADHAAAQCAETAEDYADMLVTLARNSRRCRSVSPITLNMADQPTLLQRRIEMLLNTQTLHSRPRRLVLLVIVALLGTLSLGTATVRMTAAAPDGPPTKDMLLDGLFAYPTLIKTGTFTYQFGSLLTTMDDYSQPLPWQEKGYSIREDGAPSTMELTVANDEWVLRWPDSPRFVKMHRHNFSATYYEIPQPDGDIDRRFVIMGSGGNNKPLEEQGKNQPQYRVVKAGTATPFLQQLMFLKKYRDRFEYRGKEILNGIETHLLQLCVAKEEFNEFTSIYHPEESKQDAIIVLIYVAPSLSYAAVKTELSIPDGTVTRRYEASDFAEVAEGVFFPMRYYRTNIFSMYGRENYVEQYLLAGVKNVNQPVPESSFEITAPAGTRVRDSRPGSKNACEFSIDKDVTFTDPDELANFW